MVAGAFSAAGFDGGLSDGGDICMRWPSSGSTQPHSNGRSLPLAGRDEIGRLTLSGCGGGDLAATGSVFTGRVVDPAAVLG